MKVATTKAQRKLFFNRRKMKKHLGWLTNDERAAVATDLGVSTAEVAEMEQRLSARDLSFDPQPDSDEDEQYAPVAYLPSPGSDPAQQLAEEDWTEQADARLRGARHARRPQPGHPAKAMVEEPKQTLHEPRKVQRFGGTIRQLEANAMKKLQDASPPEPRALKIRAGCNIRHRGRSRPPRLGRPRNTETGRPVSVAVDRGNLSATSRGAGHPSRTCSSF